MAEMGEQKSVRKTRNYKAIVSSTSDIRDTNPERQKRRYTALLVARNGSLFAADSVNYKEICIFNRNGKQVKTFPVDISDDEYILDMAELSDGNIAVSGYDTEVVEVFTIYGEFVREFDQEFESGKLHSPGGMAVNNDSQVFVVSNSDSKVIIFNEKGNFQYSFNCEMPDIAECYDLTGVCIGIDGLLYITDYESNRVLVFQQNGTFVHSFGSDTLSFPAGIAATNDGHLVVASSSNNNLYIFTTSGECIHEVYVSSFVMNTPLGIAVDSNDYIYVCGKYSLISVF
jgi:outer membrane protein assembly factor BamB